MTDRPLRYVYTNAIAKWTAPAFVTCISFCLPSAHATESQTIVNVNCQNALGSLPTSTEVNVGAICGASRLLDGCLSEKGEPIFHFDRMAEKNDARRVLVLALVHGDEPESAIVAKLWMERLLRIEPRSSWRVLPIVNPDGYAKNSRLNSRGVDLNRNFPTADWHSHALTHWETAARKDVRRYPGVAPASESETRCALKHIDEFKPDFVIAIHTPYGVLDFDGPKDLNFPKSFLPWVSLGHLPGSLGRFMWHDQSIPVLTVELKGKDSLVSLENLDKLQDLSGALALQIKPQSTKH